MFLLSGTPVLVEVHHIPVELAAVGNQPFVLEVYYTLVEVGYIPVEVGYTLVEVGYTLVMLDYTPAEVAGIQLLEVTQQNTAPVGRH